MDIYFPDLIQVYAEKDGDIVELDAVQLEMGGRSVTVWAKYSVTITGTPKIGQTLTANIAPSNSVIQSYQWYRNNIAIIGATNRSYTLTSADVGNVIKCRVYQSSVVYVDSASTEVVTGWVNHVGNLITMTSNTAPSGYTVSGSINGWGSSSDSSTTELYKVFDNNESTFVRCGVNSSIKKHGMSSQLLFKNPIRIKKLYVHTQADTNGVSNYTFSIFVSRVHGIKEDNTEELLAKKEYDLKGNNNNVSWVETININNTTSYKGVRVETSYGSGDAGQVQRIYGLMPVEYEVYG